MGVRSGPPNGSEESKKEWGNYEYPGDVKHMKCHNCFCAIIFLILFGCMIALLVIGIVKGKIWTLTHSWDTHGFYCGYDNTQLDVKDLPENYTKPNLVDYPYLFFDALNVSRQICVKKCPTSGSLQDILQYNATQTGHDKLQYLDNSTYNTGYYPDANETYQYTTKEYFNRCIPDVDLEKDIINGTQFVNGLQQAIDAIPALSSALNSVYSLRWQILVCALGSLVIGLIWIMLLRCLTGCIVYFVVILVPVSLIGIGVWLFVNGSVMGTIKEVVSTKKLSGAQITAVVIWCIAFIIILIIIFLWSKLKSAVAIIKVAAMALGYNFLVIFVPIITMIFCFLFWAALLVSSVTLYTSASFKYEIDNDGNDKGIGQVKFDLNKVLQYMLIYNFVYLIFISVHMYFVNYYASSVSIVKWYFSGQGGKTCCGCSCFFGFWLAWTKALGTITISSLIMTPLYLFIIFMEYLDRKSKMENAPIFIQFLIKCLKCCLWCFTKIVQYLNKVLFTIQQIFNTNFGPSAKLVVDVVISDALLTVMLNGISFFILFLSKVVVSVITTLLFMIWAYYGKNSSIAGSLLAAFVVFFLSYIVSSFLLSAYDNIIDIVFVCYQSEKSIDGYSAGEASNMVNQTIDDMKSAHQSENTNNKVSAKKMEDVKDDKTEIAVKYGK
ncbi:hypothetical protein TVAG_365660 [Trichomonas vaginalis G3]|uniref:Choline transporter-like protein n=1 Tax=Trichomonas vaginalis (strain ATCC PRA-98 / G3) TaxID=412133 RepID=A2DHL0_TRIV3|nr:choline transmembrane transporter protein [Trichomonas vaginalis G3]EAY20058.1 hypothetical protein TVAG_365660 [Trichomonas vaginalis G3]KAI5528010.1 choline transmembrane transporter protein [Trichomonas vaginalis G3]|eukprot:XP_001581044.1 hypothetical protein [Trichomonas vaginalis G3]